MSQQINLFNPEFVPRLDVLSAKCAAMTLSVAIVLALAGSAWVRWSLSQAAAAEAVLAAQSNEARSQTETMGTQLGARHVDPALEAELAAVRLSLKERKQVVTWLDTDGLSNKVGVSEYFRGLARQTLSGIWLTGFQLGADGNQLRIEGRSLSSELLPRYLDMLGAEKTLQGRSFATVAMEEVQLADAKGGAGRFVAFRLEAQTLMAAGEKR